MRAEIFLAKQLQRSLMLKQYDGLNMNDGSFLFCLNHVLIAVYCLQDI